MADVKLTAMTVAKNLGVTGKEVVSKLAEYGVELKSSSSVITEEEAGLVIDIFTRQHEMSAEEFNALRSSAAETRLAKEA